MDSNNEIMNYKINRNEEIYYEKYLNQTGFYDFYNLLDLILFIGDSKPKTK